MRDLKQEDLTLKTRKSTEDTEKGVNLNQRSRIRRESKKYHHRGHRGHREKIKKI